MSTRTANAAAKPTVKGAAAAAKTKTTAKPKGAAATTKSQKSVTLRFDHEKNTKGTARWTEQGDTKMIGTLYTRKDALSVLGLDEASVEGKTIKVTVTVE